MITIHLKGTPALKFDELSGPLVSLDTFKNIAPKNGEYIIIAENFYPADTTYMIKARGIISLFGGILSHAAIVAREFGIPTIVGVYDLSKEKEVEKIYDAIEKGNKMHAIMRGDGSIEITIK